MLCMPYGGHLEAAQVVLLHSTNPDLTRLPQPQRQATQARKHAEADILGSSYLTLRRHYPSDVQSISIRLCCCHTPFLLALLLDMTVLVFFFCGHF
ncbi:hypothetical protein DUNSADRAFT_12891 [Dunaliella salina]|uniref:Encoded protein n=1 Tax=Dunaliella salina TaxID=3046 RepID=A0ABQ7H3K3_DUNSA|nr:hypothetical protein DUNSADRAFT_12891 [Dunaliella salina]|eukprot:KAF5841447.1 hypothetical protein DUNSADRAFT_12891 [Dunaliella salina]